MAFINPAATAQHPAVPAGSLVAPQLLSPPIPINRGRGLCRKSIPPLSFMMATPDDIIPVLSDVLWGQDSSMLHATLSSVGQQLPPPGPLAPFLLSDDLLPSSAMNKMLEAVSSKTDFSTSMPSPQVLVSSLLLVTVSDMVPFVPCQPMAISMGATLGIWAYPICVVGQTMAGILAFGSSRTAADSQQVQQVLDGLGSEDARGKFQEFRQLGTSEGEGKVLLALIGLRLAPFFPFSAGNYLLGGGTGVGLRPFIVATLLGCLLSNLLSVTVGIGGSELLQSQLGIN